VPSARSAQTCIVPGQNPNAFAITTRILKITPGIHVPSIPLNLSLKRMEPAAILKIDRTIPDPNLIDISLAELAKINRVLDITSDKMKINLKIKHTALMI
jgi:hypothetical protein